MPEEPVPVSGPLPRGTKVVHLSPDEYDKGQQGPLGGAVSDLAHALIGGMLPSDSGSSKKSDPKKKPKETAAQKAAAEKAAEQKALNAQIQQVENSPWTKLSNALAQQYQQAEVPVAQAVSGSEIPGAQQSAAASALASLGLSPNSSAGQWLAGQTAAAQAQAAPVSAAMQQEAAQYANEAGPISQAIQAYGQANALSEITAPESAWLNALATHIQSNLSYYGVVPTASLGSLAPSVAQALQLSGGYSGTSGAGTTPIQNITANPAGGSRATTNANLLSGGTSSAGVIPSAGTNPGS